MADELTAVPQNADASPVVTPAPVITPVETPQGPEAPDVSQGYPVPRTPTGMTADSVEIASSIPAIPVVDGKPTEVPVVPSTNDKAISERLKQQNARQAKLLSSLGLDPLSDLGEQLEAGMISEEMIRDHVLGKFVPQAPPTRSEVGQYDPAQMATPVSQAEAELAAAEEAYDKEVSETGQVTLQTNKRVQLSQRKLYEAQLADVRQEVTADRQRQQANANVESVLGIARNQPEYAVMTDDLKQASDEVTLALTGTIADQQSRASGRDPARLTPTDYAYYAKQASARLSELAQFYINMGQQQVRQNLTPKPPGILPSPAGPTGNPAEPANVFARVNHVNHQEAAKQYIAGSRRM